MDKTIENENDNDCPICYDELDEMAETLKCNHKFHYACILKTYMYQIEKKREYLRECPFSRNLGGELTGRPGTIPIKGIHKNYNAFLDCIEKLDCEGLQEYFNDGKCYAVIKNGDNKGLQCKSSSKPNSIFCGRHTKII